MNTIKFLIFLCPFLSGAALYFSNLNLKSTERVLNKMVELNSAVSDKVALVSLNQDILFEKIDRIKLNPNLELSDEDRKFISNIGVPKIKLEFPTEENEKVSDELINGKLPELPNPDKTKLEQPKKKK